MHVNAAEAHEPSPEEAQPQMHPAEPATAAADPSARRPRYGRINLSLVILAAIALVAALHFARTFFVPLDVVGPFGETIPIEV